LVVTQELLDRSPIAWALDDEVIEGRRLVDVVRRGEVELVYGDPADPVDQAVTVLAAEIISGTEIYDGWEAVTITVGQDGSVVGLVDVDELDRIARAAGSPYATAPVDLLQSLITGQPVALGVLVTYLDADLVRALAEALEAIAAAS